MKPRATLLSVYRRRNAGVLAGLLQPALQADWSAHLWALDEPDPSLADLTRGTGPGSRFDLLNRLVANASLGPSEHVVIADDDAVFVRGDVVSFLATAVHAGFGLAQPAHVLRSNISHRITWRRPLSRARLTTFVEIGPIVAVSPAWQAQVLPFPDAAGMGWGLDIEWMELRALGCRLGIVDETLIRHLSPFATDYVVAEEAERMHERLRERGHEDWGRMRHTLATWWIWQRAPSWLRQAAPTSPS